MWYNKREILERGRAMTAGTITIDLHGMTCAQAQAAIDAALRRAGRGVYRIEVIHGYHRGSALRDMVRRTYAAHPKVKRLEMGMNLGATELVLREY